LKRIIQELLKKKINTPNPVGRKVRPSERAEKMKKYNVVMRESYAELFDNWVGDYTEAENEAEAIALVKDWLNDHGYDGDVDGLEFRVSEI
jgi:hypothetical protein